MLYKLKAMTCIIRSCIKTGICKFRKFSCISDMAAGRDKGNLQCYENHAGSKRTADKRFTSNLIWWYKSPDVHDDVIQWKQLPRNRPFVRGIPRSPVNSPHKGQWRGALMISLICVWINGWVNNREAGDLRRYRVYYDVTNVFFFISHLIINTP